MCSELETYISRYYDDWLQCSRRWCSMLGIPQESYDLLADVLLSLCQKPEGQLQELLGHERDGDRKLFFYVRKTVRLQIFSFRREKFRPACSIDLLPNLAYSDDMQELPDKMFEAFRAEEAKIRSDDFFDPEQIYTGDGRLTRFVTFIKTQQGYRIRVKFDAAKDGQRRQFYRRSSAIAFLAGQNPPPEKNRWICVKTALNKLYMTITQIHFLDRFAQQLVSKGFDRKDYDRTVVLRKRMTIANGTGCVITLSWLPYSWAIVKVQIAIDSLHCWFDASVGPLMDNAGWPDKILCDLIKKTTAGIAEKIIQNL